MSRSADTPFPLHSSTTQGRVQLIRLGWTLSSFMVISFVTCIILGYILPGLRDLMPVVFFPGFSWDQPSTMLWGLAWSIAVGWYVALLFGILYNGFGKLVR